MEKKRLANIDFLRIIATIFVIVIHVSQLWVKYIRNTENIEFGYNMVSVFILNSISKYGVPIFLMIGGGFVLSDEKNKNANVFYKKSFYNIVMPTIIFSFMYIVYAYLKVLRHYDVNSKKIETFFLPIIDLFRGKPFYHLWYLYVLLGIYLLVPAIIIIKREIGEIKFFAASIPYMLVAFISHWVIDDYYVEWNIGKVTSLLAFVLLGYFIKKISIEGGGYKYILCSIIISIILALLRCYVTVTSVSNNIGEGAKIFLLDNNCSPFIVLGSAFMYAGFVKLKVKTNKIIKFISPLTIYIYLTHVIVLDVITMKFQVNNFQGVNGKIFLLSTIIFLISTIMAFIFDYLYKSFGIKYQIEKVTYIYIRKVFIQYSNIIVMLYDKLFQTKK